MMFNQATDYAFRIILMLAKYPLGTRVEALEISETECIPERYLFKVMRKLSKAGIIKSYRGTHGGFALARLPETVTLLDVVEAIEGPVYLNVCFKNANQCNRRAVGACAVHQELAKLRHDIYNRLNAINFKELLDKEQTMKGCDLPFVRENEIVINREKCN